MVFILLGKAHGLLNSVLLVLPELARRHHLQARVRVDFIEVLERGR